MKRNWSTLRGYLLGTFSPAAVYLVMISAGYTSEEIIMKLGYTLIFAGIAVGVFGFFPLLMWVSCMFQRKLDFFEWRGYRLEWSIVTVFSYYVIAPSAILSGLGFHWLVS